MIPVGSSRHFLLRIRILRSRTVRPYGEVAGGPGLGAIVMCCSERGFGELLRLEDDSGRGYVGVPGRQGGRLVKSLVPL